MSTLTLSRIKVTCSCGKKYLVRPELAGKRGRCKCGQVFTVPTQKKEISTPKEKICPECGGSLGGFPICTFCARKTADKTAERLKELDKKSVKKSQVISSNTSKAILFTSAGCVSAVLLSQLTHKHLNGPEFLVLYFCIGFACFLGVYCARYYSWSVIVALLLIASFEAIGGLRLNHGLSQGMHNFGNLIMMMVLGPAVMFFFSFADFGSSSGASSFGSYSSGCSSGCGGGGGCGGCGG